jgi:hypothetical protein
LGQERQYCGAQYTWRSDHFGGGALASNGSTAKALF